MDFEQQIREMLGSLQEQLATFEERQAEIAAAVGSGESANGLVTVEVGAGGSIKDLTISPRAMRLDSQTLRDSVLEAIEAANADLTEVLRQHAMSTVDVAGLARKVELPGELSAIMDRFDRRASDVEQTIATLRRSLHEQAR